MKIGLAVAMALLMGAAVVAQPATGDRASAMLAEPGGRVVGRATVTQESGGARVVVEIEGLAAGTYGTHIHRTGRCEGPAFDSAGAHWNPTGQQHGFRNPSGRHRGDLPNLVVGANGRGRLTFTIRAAVLRGEAGMIDADGTAVMIHARPDDYRTDPSGNSGARIACGVLN
ncbi:superoxide dismutase family protein [Sphingosinicella sp.]|uniref:superoxide dismutase family protein n=1 Tax=Sphingosinicella sp. TaxID=1917971 RepID=UPI0040384A04